MSILLPLGFHGFRRCLGSRLIRPDRSVSPTQRPLEELACIRNHTPRRPPLDHEPRDPPAGITARYHNPFYGVRLGISTLFGLGQFSYHLNGLVRPQNEIRPGRRIRMLGRSGYDHEVPWWCAGGLECGRGGEGGGGGVEECLKLPRCNGARELGRELVYYNNRQSVISWYSTLDQGIAYPQAVLHPRLHAFLSVDRP